MKRLALCLLLLCAVRLPAAAHVLDQYLQAAQLTLAPSGVTVELRLTPGTQVADRIFTLLDADRDGQLSAAETQAYGERVRQDLVLKTDGQTLSLLLTEADFPTRYEMDEGTGAIRLKFTATADLSAPDAHHLAFQNHHLPEMSAYLVNALVPAAREIAITGQHRDALQRELRLDYRVTPAAVSAMRWLMLLAISLGLVVLARRQIYKVLHPLRRVTTVEFSRGFQPTVDGADRPASRSDA